jgi:hypothetical protein
VAWGINVVFFSPAMHAQDFSEDDARFTPTFRNTPLSEVTEFVARATERTIEGPDSRRFQAVRVTYLGQRPLTRSDLWQLFVQVLESNELVVMASEDHWRIEEQPSAEGSETEVPDNWRPFTFNGRTFYFVPLKDE